MNYEEENLSQEEREKRVYNLTVELKDMKSKKKSHMKAYGEEIKRIEGEIKDLVSKDQETFEIK
jgi:hypothetical protein